MKQADSPGLLGQIAIDVIDLIRLRDERDASLALLKRFAALDTDPHVTDAEWSQFRRDVHALFAKAKGGD